MLVPDVSALAPGYLRELLESQHIKSLVAVPTLGLESCKGFVGFDWVNSHHSGSEGEEHLLTIFAQNLVNIQQRKQANDALRESQSLYYSLVEVSPLSICRKDLDGRFTFANKKFLETSQLTLADLLGKSDYDLHPSELAEKYRRDDLEVIKSGQVKELIEGRAVVGEPISANVVQTVKVPVYGGDGKINGIQISFWDITERIRAEELLKESEKRFHSLFDNSPISLWEEDFSAVRQRLGELSASSSADFSAFLEEHPEIATECIGLIKVLDVNKATLNLFKAAGMQQIVEHLWDIYQANDRQNFNSELALIASGITHFEIETSKQRLDGKTLAISLNWAAVPGYEGDLSKVIVSMIDITERKQAEKELLETNRQLEETIFRANIFAAQAEMANIAKSAFLANMSHEIRTPMNGVIGMTGLLMDTNLDEEQRRYAEIVRTSGEALLTLINDILDFSKIEAGKMELETLDFDLESMLDDFAVSLALRAQEKGLEFLCAADPDVPTLLQGDPGRLRQILTNLVGNAIKFTARGEVAVRVSVEKTQPVMANYAEKSDTAFAALRFSIRDTGIGIPPEKLGLLFNKFSQVDASTTRQYGGTGLGLAISKQLVEMMNGRVGVKSEPGRGSEFWFTVRLPLQTASRASEIPAQANLAGVRILVVDDNAASRTILKTRLTSWGLLPSEAQDGDSALLALNGAREAGDPFQVAILDMQMPGMNGAMLGEAIKNDECLANTHLILLSSLGERGDARRFAKIGFVGYLTKPLRHVDLFNVLSLTLTGGDAPAGSSAIVTRHSAREIRRVTASSSARILLAEDNITNQQVALGILTKLGYKADAVANGLEAITALENIPYDVVLMDVQMPELDGVDATRIIRNDKSLVLNHAIPIIAMTAHALQIDRERCLKAGMNDYITKPVNPQALAQALERWLPAGLPMAETPASTPRVPGFESNGLVFDKAALMHRLMDDDELANLIISGFLEDMPVQINRLKAGLEDGDVTLVERQAHSIKGAASNMGGDALRDIAAELEKSAKTSDLSGVQALMGELDLQFARLRAELENEI
jgi:PAS domain S-box-containing protein